MTRRIPDETIQTFARTVGTEAVKYGFSQVDIVRLINALIEVTTEGSDRADDAEMKKLGFDPSGFSVSQLPALSDRLRIRRLDPEHDLVVLERWMNDDYGAHFLLSCSSAQRHELVSLVGDERNLVGLVELTDGMPIGAVAFLDIDRQQRRAELRKLIGSRNARGKGYAQEATALWIEYGFTALQLEKIYVSTLQTHIRNIELNESVGFRVEGLLRSEVLVGDERHDLLRMGLCRDQFRPHQNEV